ncbi:hypothetical protein [Flammeovirga sp. SubArs3]|uniref:hypothetical protein n=1 Tax=Flammeovirga sp. SubArs3 TaxID=2995316 RepID=UPI00248B8388|nr:hypothetical protein [Flammeovirga sp. SubArs3]
METLSSLYTSKEYIRIFIKFKDEKDFINSYIKNFNAKVEYVFEMPKYGQLRVVALTSPFGNISVVITDSFDGFPEYLINTKVLYWTDDIDKVIAVAKKENFIIHQEKTPVPIGYQGRFEMPGGYVVELAEVNDGGKKYFNPDLEELGYIS